MTQALIQKEHLMRMLLGFVFGAALTASLAFRSRVESCQYQVIPGETDVAALNIQGSHGWELVAVTATSSGKPAFAFFKNCR